MWGIEEKYILQFNFLKNQPILICIQVFISLLWSEFDFFEISLDQFDIIELVKTLRGRPIYV